MIQTRTVIKKSRHVRDIYMNRRYRVVAVFPGGREIEVAKAPTRERAFRAAIEKANRVQTSPTAGGLNFDPGGRIGEDWKFQNRRPIQFQF